MCLHSNRAFPRTACRLPGARDPFILATFVRLGEVTHAMPRVNILLAGDSFFCGSGVWCKIAVSVQPTVDA